MDRKSIFLLSILFILGVTILALVIALPNPIGHTQFVYDDIVGTDMNVTLWNNITVNNNPSFKQLAGSGGTLSAHCVGIQTMRFSTNTSWMPILDQLDNVTFRTNGLDNGGDTKLHIDVFGTQAFESGGGGGDHNHNANWRVIRNGSSWNVLNDTVGIGVFALQSTVTTPTNNLIQFECIGDGAGGDSTMVVWYMNYSTRASQINTTLLIPSNNSFNITEEVVFEANITKDHIALNATFINSTLFIWRDNGTIFNITTNIITGNESNHTNYSILNFDIGNYEWNVLACLDDFGTLRCNWNDEDFNRSFTYGYIINSQTFEGTIGDLTNTSFELNLTTIAGLTFSAGNLIYNGVARLADTLLSGGDTIFSRTITTPSVEGNTNFSFNWNFTLSNGETNNFETAELGQLVTPSVFSFCNSTFATVAVNYTTRDEETRSQLNTSFDATFSWNLGGDINKNASFSFLEGNSSYAFCISPNATFFVDAQIRVDAALFSERLFTFPFKQYTNDTTNISLYLLNESLGTDVIIEVKDIGFTPLEGYTVKIFRKVEGTGEQILVENEITDFFGQMVASLVEKNVKYRFEFYDTNNLLVKVVPEAIVACRAVICKQVFIIDTGENIFSQFGELEDYTSSLTFNNNTNEFRFVWVDNRGENAIQALNVTRRLFNGTTIVCDDSSATASGSIVCPVGDVRASYTAQSYRITSDGSRRFGLLNIEVGSLVDTFGLEGVFWSMILLIAMISIGVFYPPIGIALYLITIFFLGIFDILYINPAIMIAEIVIGVLAIWFFRG